ncbi:M23 family metallopeptidase [Cardinium endosymbiont of Oedothorax gibbosus]|uniref:M23 family metallopeptidase n=1 Tax=Cardinium endosymbiont of Oedothorax gibbosus TaxID=931101 RepID=UPI002024BDCB|nr:peptidoglycan DD-metalloendopeptidase family protein [Cardinium endosymbiont of Oedothorax gibbosus]CAH2559962.1 Peptidase M23 family protein [Cardinium endosymbiont of Oedothorax gibbosus]
MLKTKYYYNPATCSYERVQTSISAFILRSSLYIFFSVLLAVVIVRYYRGCFVSSREKELLADNKVLKDYYDVIQKKIERSAALLAALQQRDDDLYRVLLNAAPLSAAEHNAGVGGVNKYAHLGKSTLIAQTLSKVDQLISQLTIQKKSYDQIWSLAKRNSSRLQSMPTLPPVAKEHLKRISAPFGMRWHPIYKIRRMHQGVDFSAPMHTPIYAAADGYVQWVKNDKRGYGNHLLIDHRHGFQTHCAHMHTIIVKQGQRVTRGQQIGTVGNSGDSTAPHLHYETYHNGHRVNPFDYFVGELTPAEYEAVRQQAAHQTQALCSNF